MIYYTKDNYVYTHFVEGGNKTTIKDVDDIDCRMVTLTGNKLIVNKCRGDVIYGYKCVGIEPLQKCESQRLKSLDEIHKYIFRNVVKYIVI